MKWKGAVGQLVQTNTMQVLYLVLKGVASIEGAASKWNLQTQRDFRGKN